MKELAEGWQKALAESLPPAKNVAPMRPAHVMPDSSIHRLNPDKLHLSKWTAVNPCDQEKHFLVIRVIHPEAPAHRIEHVVLEAVLTRRRFTLRWTELADPQHWRQGWR